MLNAEYWRENVNTILATGSGLAVIDGKPCCCKGTECSDFMAFGAVQGENFSFIMWADNEPWSVEDLRKLPALEYNPEDVGF